MRQHIRIDETQVRAKAYELWKERGCPDGSGDQDWIEAERLLSRERSSPRAALPSSPAPAAAIDVGSDRDSAELAVPAPRLPAVAPVAAPRQAEPAQSPVSRGRQAEAATPAKAPPAKGPQAKGPSGKAPPANGAPPAKTKKSRAR